MNAFVMVAALFLLPLLVRRAFGRREPEYWRMTRVMSPITRLVIIAVALVFAAVMIKG